MVYSGGAGCGWWVLPCEVYFLRLVAIPPLPVPSISCRLSYWEPYLLPPLPQHNRLLHSIPTTDLNTKQHRPSFSLSYIVRLQAFSSPPPTSFQARQYATTTLAKSLVSQVSIAGKGLLTPPPPLPFFLTIYNLPSTYYNYNEEWDKGPSSGSLDFQLSLERFVCVCSSSSSSLQKLQKGASKKESKAQ